jgi:peptidoglycan/xylan/chitin deacetylase (PgdA/CDA1 family)
MSRRVKRAIKELIAYGLYYTGMLRLLQSVILRRRAVVLMYHRVLSLDERRDTGSHPGIVVTRKTFARQIAVLKRQFVPLSLDEFAERMERRLPFASSSCLVTFDDGWHDNFTNALPILRHHGVPAVVFLPVNFVGQQRLFWREALTHLMVELVHRGRRDPSVTKRCEPLLRSIGLERVLEATGTDPRPFVIDVIASHTGLKTQAVEPLLMVLSAELGICVEDLRTPDTFIDWEQAEAMSRDGIAFGGHGADHRLLTDIGPDAADREIGAAREMMRRTFNDTVPTFSYPNGNWNPEVVDRVKRSGYRLAFTTVPGFVSCDDDRFTVKRLNVHESATDSTPMFLARVVGLF